MTDLLLYVLAALLLAYEGISWFISLPVVKYVVGFVFGYFFLTNLVEQSARRAVAAYIPDIARAVVEAQSRKAEIEE